MGSRGAFVSVESGDFTFKKDSNGNDLMNYY